MRAKVSSRHSLKQVDRIRPWFMFNPIYFSIAQAIHQQRESLFSAGSCDKYLTSILSERSDNETPQWRYYYRGVWPNQNPFSWLGSYHSSRLTSKMLRMSLGWPLSQVKFLWFGAPPKPGEVTSSVVLIHPKRPLLAGTFRRHGQPLLKIPSMVFPV
jgi:hypothetical protein